MVSHHFISHHFIHYLNIDIYPNLWLLISTICKGYCPQFVDLYLHLDGMWCEKRNYSFLPLYLRMIPQPIQISNCEFGWLYDSLKLRMNKKSLIRIGWENQIYNTMGGMNNFSTILILLKNSGCSLYRYH